MTTNAPALPLIPEPPTTPSVTVLSRPKRLALGFLTSIVSLGLSFAVVEAVARRLEAGLSAAKMRGDALALMQPNPAGTGSYRLKPNLDLTTRVKGLEVHVRTNSYGMPWREVTRQKPPRVRRVAFMGDSFTFGCWARSYEQAFAGVFEQGLDRRRFEALSFGVGGYGLGDVELLLREQAIWFEPDWVVVMLFAGNDLRDTWLGVHKDDVADGTPRLREDVLAARVPREFRRPEARLATPAPDPSWVRAQLKRTATFRLLLPRLGLDHLWLEFGPSRRFTSFTFWSQQPPPPVVLRARDEMLATLGRLAEFAHEHRARLAVVTIPYREQVLSREWSGRGFDVSYPQVWVQVWAGERGVPYFDLLPRLREHALTTNEDLYLEDDIHWNERGHALVGEWLREWFQTQLDPRG